MDFSRIVDYVLSGLVLALFFGSVIFFLFYTIILAIRIRFDQRYDNEQARKRAREVIARLERMQKVTRKPGSYHPRRWATKWITYSKDIPAIRQHYKLNGGELPDLPGRKERMK